MKLAKTEQWRLERVAQELFVGKDIKTVDKQDVAIAIEHVLSVCITLASELENEKKRSQALEQGISELRAAFDKLVGE